MGKGGSHPGKVSPEGQPLNGWQQGRSCGDAKRQTKPKINKTQTNDQPSPWQLPRTGPKQCFSMP